MFSLIITVISVALVVALIVSMMYHGGDVYDKGQVEARAAQSVNEVSQIQAAMVSYNANTGEQVPNIATLAPDYLKTVPTGWGSTSLPSQTAFEASLLNQGSDAANLAVCEQVNVKLGKTATPPLCSEIASDYAGCCVEN